MSSIILGDVLDELGLWGHVSRLIGASGHSTALTCGSSCGASYSVGCFCRTAAGRQKGGIGMAFNRIALVSCVINVQKPSTIYSAACLVGRSGPWSISLGDGGSFVLLPQASFADWWLASRKRVVKRHRKAFDSGPCLQRYLALEKQFEFSTVTRCSRQP
jgi:hypothetical protein